MRRRLLILLLLLLLTQALQLLQQLFRSLNLLLLLLLRRRRLWGHHLLRRDLLNGLAHFSATLEHWTRLIFFLLFSIFGWTVWLGIRSASAGGSGPMRTEDDRPHVRRIIKTADEDEVVPGAIEKRIQHIARHTWAKLAEDALCIWTRSLDSNTSRPLYSAHNIRQ